MKKYRVYTRVNGRLSTWEAWANSHQEARAMLVTKLIVQGEKHGAVLAVLA